MRKGYRKEFCINGHSRVPENVGANSNCLLCSRDRAKRFNILHPEVKRKFQHRIWEPLKREVLTHYSAGMILKCSWSDCCVADLDMLTLDHVNDDGYKHTIPGRKSRLCGRALYNRLKQERYPEGFQTLCWNHQWKKRLLSIHSAFLERNKGF